MKEKKHPTFVEKIDLIKSLEEFFSNYEPKFGEKIKVRRFLKNLNDMKEPLTDTDLAVKLKEKGYRSFKVLGQRYP